MRFLPLIWVILFAVDVQAQSYVVREEDSVERISLGIVGSYGQLMNAGRTLQGFGYEANGLFRIGERLSAGLCLFQALDAATNVTALYTGFRSVLNYSFTHSLFGRTRKIIVDEKVVVINHQKEANVFSVESGLEQIFLNSTTNVAPTTGFTFGVRYDFAFRSFAMMAVARTGVLTLESATVTPLSVGLGVAYKF